MVRDTAWPDYRIKFTGTTIWRTLLAWNDVKDLDPRFETTAWWHTPTTHVYFSPVGEGLWEIAARAWHDPAVHSASKVSWGVPVDNAHVESHFTVRRFQSSGVADIDHRLGIPTSDSRGTRTCPSGWLA